MERSAASAAHGRGAAAADQCERHALCTRGFRHHGKGGCCSFKAIVAVGGEEDDDGGQQSRRHTPETPPTEEPRQRRSTAPIHAYGEELIGSRVRVWWEAEPGRAACWFAGRVKQFITGGEHVVQYDDGDTRFYNLNDPDTQWERLREVPSSGREPIEQRLSRALSATVRSVDSESSELLPEPGVPEEVDGVRLVLSSTSNTGYKGVSRILNGKAGRPFQATGPGNIALGRFATAVEAAKAYAKSHKHVGRGRPRKDGLAPASAEAKAADARKAAGGYVEDDDEEEVIDIDDEEEEADGSAGHEATEVVAHPTWRPAPRGRHSTELALARDVYEGEGEPCPELGDGWLKVTRRRNSGVKAQSIDKFYVSPDGQRFNSRVKAQRHLSGEAEPLRASSEPRPPAQKRLRLHQLREGDALEVEVDDGPEGGGVVWKPAEVVELLAGGRFVVCINGEADFIEEYGPEDEGSEWRAVRGVVFSGGGGGEHLPPALKGTKVTRAETSGFGGGFGNGRGGGSSGGGDGSGASDGVCRRFWQAGDYSSVRAAEAQANAHDTDGCERARTHPKFLHSNATSHKWAIGAIAELLDNSMDENSPSHPVAIQVDVRKSSGGPMLVVKDNGGGMDRAAMHRMMSFGVSHQSAGRIGRYGNGFKSSSMRLGADALVLSVDRQSGSFVAGLLSYTFLRATNAQDVVVPIVEWDALGRAPDLEAAAAEGRASALATLLKWGPGLDEPQLKAELRKLRPHGTAVLIYNLWQTESGEPELDLFSDLEDVRTRPAAVDDELEDARARGQRQRNPNAPQIKEKYFGFRHSLRQYASILYLNHPPGFSMSLRGQLVEPRNILKDLKYKKVESWTPRGQTFDEDDDVRQPKSYKIHLGFAREAPDADAQGFNIYHDNRLIKPMWEVYKSPSSVGRGVIGVVEVDFVKPSHDKQDFERTDAMCKLEAKLKALTPAYWKENGRRVGYQNANPLPPTRKEREDREREQQLEALDAARAAELGVDDCYEDARAGTSLLFQAREGGRKRRLPAWANDFRVEHGHGGAPGAPPPAGRSGGGGGRGSQSVAALLHSAVAALPPDGPDECAICFEAVTIDNVSGGVTPCGHIFHTECILHWLREQDVGPGRHPLCAICRDPLHATRSRVFAPLRRTALEVSPPEAAAAASAAAEDLLGDDELQLGDELGEEVVQAFVAAAGDSLHEGAGCGGQAGPSSAPVEVHAEMAAHAPAARSPGGASTPPLPDGESPGGARAATAAMSGVELEESPEAELEEVAAAMERLARLKQEYEDQKEIVRRAQWRQRELEEQILAEQERVGPVGALMC